jgi:hypothetical protein
LLVRYGPYKAAKYRVQTANGYNTAGLQKVSKLKSRISHITYESQDGEEHKRYTRNNIVGIVGVAIHERKDTTKDYKSAPTTYVKIKWQDIDEADQKLLKRARKKRQPTTQILNIPSSSLAMYNHHFSFLPSIKDIPFMVEKYPEVTLFPPIYLGKPAHLLKGLHSGSTWAPEISSLWTI